MLSHRIMTIEDHHSNYRNWAQKAKANGNDEAGLLLADAAEMPLAINEKFTAALELANK